MKCAVCRHGEMVDGIMDYQAKINGSYVVVKNVPVQECNICGEQFMSYETVKKIESFSQTNTAPVTILEVPVYDMAV